MHIPYPKIRRIGTEETEGIFDYPVYIQEKIDGANLQIGIDEGGIYIGSRTQLVYSNGKLLKEFGGVEKYVLNHEGINKALNIMPYIVLYGEWLVKHTIVYPEKYYNKFYLFDVYDKEIDWFFNLDDVYYIASKYEIETPELFYKGMSDLEQAKSFVGKSSMEVPGEGIVIKSNEFINKFGNKQYGKIVREEFKEANQIVFGNYNRGDAEMEFATKFVNEARVWKIVNKIEQNEGRKIKIEDTPKVMGMVYYDVFTEELRGYAGKRTIDFSRLQKTCGERAKYFFHNFILFNG